MLNLIVLCLIMYARGDWGEVNSIVGPMIVVAIVTLIASNIFLGIFDEAVTALMTSLCIDTDLN